ncbi:MAG: hypothetical protein AB7E47_16950 [Desulfovibrionaceae bacterium]
MSKAWIRAKIPEFTRDLVRDFCLVAKELELRFRDFEKTGLIEFEALRALLGEEMNKGLMWRLKDTAHHLFRNDPKSPLVGRYLDWGLGYIFHETFKLKEDAYQRLYYAPWFKDLEGRCDESVEQFAHELSQVLPQTRESIARETARIRFILRQCLDMIPQYLFHHKDNELVARFLFMQNDLVREVFGEAYENLVHGIYGNKPEMLHVLAARSLREGGWMAEAESAVGLALKRNPESRSAKSEKALLEHELPQREAR